MQKLNLVIFSGSNKLITDNILINNLKKIANNISLNTFNVGYGGGDSGIMGVIPKHFEQRGGDVFAVDAIQFAKYGSKNFGKVTMCETFTERQNKLVDRGDIYLCLPGGVGTVSELFDTLVNNDVNKANKKIVLYSYNNFFDPIVDFIKKNIESGYIRPHVMDHLSIFNNHDDIITYLNNINK